MREPCPTCFNNNVIHSNHNAEEEFKNLNSELNIKVPLLNSHTRQELSTFLNAENSHGSKSDQTLQYPVNYEKMISSFKENLDKSIEKAKDLSLGLHKKNHEIQELKTNNKLLKQKLKTISDVLVKNNSTIMKLESKELALEKKITDLKQIKDEFSNRIEKLEEEKRIFNERSSNEEKRNKAKNLDILKEIKTLASIEMKERGYSKLNNNVIQRVIRNIEGIIKDEKKHQSNFKEISSEKNTQKNTVLCQKCGFRLSPRDINEKKQFCSGCFSK